MISFRRLAIYKKKMFGMNTLCLDKILGFMKGRVLFFFILAFVCPSVMAQHDDAFDAYCAEGMHQYGIAVKRLADFEVIDDHAIFMPSKKDSTGMWFEFVLESEDKDCFVVSVLYT